MSHDADPRMVRLGRDDWDALLELDQAAFAFDPAQADSADDLDAFEWDRTWGAVRPAAGPLPRVPSPSWGEGEELAGQYTSYSMELTVPSADGVVRRTPMAGLSWVAVHPDHRRRGVLTAMMRHHLHGLHDSGEEAVAGLFASETEIYQRFGYAEAAGGLSLTLPTGTKLRPLLGGVETSPVRTQLAWIEPDGDLAGLVHELYLRSGTRPGRLTRSETMTRIMVRDRPWRHRDGEANRVILARVDGRATGYALLRRTARWEHGQPAGTVRVLELVGVDAPTRHALWSRAVSFDLMATVETPAVGVDDPLLEWVVDLRSVAARREDGLWLRLVDVDRALMARGYGQDVDVVIAIQDDVCPWNARSWRLTVTDGSASCVASSDPADVTVPIVQLGAAYLGAHSLAALHSAGLVLEHRSGAVQELSRAMRGDTEPSVPQMF